MKNLSKEIINAEIIEHYKNNKIDIKYYLNKSKIEIFYINDKKYKNNYIFDSNMQYLFIKRFNKNFIKLDINLYGIKYNKLDKDNLCFNRFYI